MRKARVAVVGGGLAGLVAARRLAAKHEVHLFESAPELGGKLQTAQFRGRAVDLGPDAFITRNPAAMELCGELGLDDARITPAARSAAVFARGKLRPLPRGLAIGIPTDPVALYRSGVLTRRAVLRCATDLLRRGPVGPKLAGAATGADQDQSVEELLAGRLGHAVLDTLVDSLIGGINASDIASLSFAAALPQLVPLLERTSSVMRGLRPLASRARVATAPSPFASLSGGLGTLTAALASDCATRGVQLQRATGAERLTPLGGRDGWRLETTVGEEELDGVVLALPAHQAAPLLQSYSAELAGGLGAIPYADVVTVTLAFAAGAVPAGVSTSLGQNDAITSSTPLPGAGLLVPRNSGRLITAASFTSTKWPTSAAEGEVVIRASAGRHHDRRAIELDDEELLAAVRADLELVLGISETPLEHRICRFPASFPQYVKGHQARLTELRRLSGMAAPLVLTGAAYDGIGIPACIASATRQAELLELALER